MPLISGVYATYHVSRILFTLPTRLRNDLYCVEWDVKLYYTIPLPTMKSGAGPANLQSLSFLHREGYV